MTTPEALVKYYDCLRESFNRIQDKDNETALVNAALRPKVSEEFEKSRDVLISYLNYIQVFSLVYSDHFLSICLNILVPLFNDYEYKLSDELEPVENRSNQDGDRAIKLHEAIQNIVESRPELGEEFSHTVAKIFPKLDEPTFLTYLRNCFQACFYLCDEPLATIVCKILDRLSCQLIAPKDQNEEAVTKAIAATQDEAYNISYEYISTLDEDHLTKLVRAILSSYADNFISRNVTDEFKYFILYICSLKAEFSDMFISLLWKTFTDSNRPPKERQDCVKFISSLISRANFLELSRVFDFLNLANNWCEEFLNSEHAEMTYNEEVTSENIDLFHTVIHSMLYLISQRYREMYETESIEKLEQLNLRRIFECRLKPLETCDSELIRRFTEVASLYHITISLPETTFLPAQKRRKSEIDPSKSNHKWTVPFRETCNSLPDRIIPLYRNYFDPRNFTINRI